MMGRPDGNLVQVHDCAEGSYQPGRCATSGPWTALAAVVALRPDQQLHQRPARVARRGTADQLRRLVDAERVPRSCWGRRSLPWPDDHRDLSPRRGPVAAAPGRSAGATLTSARCGVGTDAARGAGQHPGPEGAKLVAPLLLSVRTPRAVLEPTRCAVGSLHGHPPRAGDDPRQRHRPGQALLRPPGRFQPGAGRAGRCDAPLGRAAAAGVAMRCRATVGYAHPTPGSLQGVQLNLDDVAAVHALLLGRGVEVSPIQDHPWGRFCFFSDPDGNGWSIHGPLPAR